MMINMPDENFVTQIGVKLTKKDLMKLEAVKKKLHLEENSSAAIRVLIRSSYDQIKGSHL